MGVQLKLVPSLTGRSLGPCWPKFLKHTYFSRQLLTFSHQKTRAFLCHSVSRHVYPQNKQSNQPHHFTLTTRLVDRDLRIGREESSPDPAVPCELEVSARAV